MGLSHVALTVSDLDISTAWYARLFNSEPVLDEDEESGAYHHTVFQLESGMLFGLHAHGVTRDGTFDERRVGLDHVAFTCARDDLDSWRDKLDALGIAHGGIKHAHYGSGISFRDPDNIALEIFAPPA